MASNFPNAVDSFINPQYTKVNGVDFVKAEHVNDLQDAVKNVQLSIIGSGLNIGFGSNNYVPANADIKTAVEILDGVVFDRETEHTAHLNANMPTDPFQHHSNVIQVTSIGNLNSTRLQYALEEHQSDIDNIMTGGSVESISLDDRYILAGGPAVVTGSMSVQGDFEALSNVTLGSTLSHTVDISGDLTVGRNLHVLGDSLFGSDIKMPDISKLGPVSNIQYSHLAFGADFVNLHSVKDIEFKIDSNDPVDGLSENAEFRIINGVSTVVMNLSEAGVMNVAASVSSSELNASTKVEIGSSEPATIQNNSLSAESSSFLLQVDSDNDSANDWFAATQNGDNASLDNSTDILIKAKEDEFIAGNHVLKRSVPETGYFGLKFYSDNAGGRFQGQGVNFKSKMLTAPSSVTLNINLGLSTNYNNTSITDLNEYGFFVECDSLAIGNCELKGTYETVGN
jgi:hypothetical protein